MLLPGFADSTRNVAATPGSPPAANPCSILNKIINIGDMIPMLAYDGSRPIAKVDPDISKMTLAKIFFRPSLSPS